MPEEVVVVKAPQKQAAVIVTSENRAEFMEKKLDIEPAKPVEEKKEEKVEAKTEEKKEEVKVEPKDPKADKKHELNERFSKLTQDRKDAVAKAEAAEKARVAAEARAAELEAKIAPKKEEPKTEAAPQRSQFNTDEDYVQALTDYRVDQRLAERDRAAAEEREKAAQTARVTTFKERLAAAHKENPDLQAKIDASTAVVSDQVREAIIDSEHAPRILEHFADHPEEAARIGKLTVGGALREIGKLEARFEAPEKTNTVTPEKKDNVVEISRAPAPISPLKGNGTAVDSPVNSAGEFHGSYADWKAARKAGKIK